MPVALWAASIRGTAGEVGIETSERTLLASNECFEAGQFYPYPPSDFHNGKWSVVPVQTVDLAAGHVEPGSGFPNGDVVADQKNWRRGSCSGSLAARRVPHS